MASSERQPVSATFLPGTRAAIVLVPFFLFVWLVVDTRLLYFWPTPFFPAYRLGTAFAGDFFGRVGGPAHYAAAFLSQLYYCPWAGAAILTVVAGSLCGAAYLYLGTVGGRRPALIHWAPLPIVAALVVRYAHHLDALLAVLLAAFLAWVYLRHCRRRAWLTVVSFIALSLTVHYGAGAAVLLFALLCVLGELAAGRWAAAAFCAVWGAGLPWLTARWLLPTRLRFAYGALLWFGTGQEPSGRWLLASLYGYWPAAGVVALARAVVARRRGRADGAEAAPGFWDGHPLLKASLCTAVMLLATASTAWFAMDRSERALRRIEFYSRTQQWDALLASARELPSAQYVLTVSWDVNQALCHMGLLGERMFAWPQRTAGLLAQPLLLSSDQARFDASLELSDAFMDVGQLNEAELFAYQAMELLGAHPYILRRVALTALGRGQTAAARVLLNALAKDLVYRSWARQMLSDLDADTSLPNRPDVQALLRARPEKDFVGWFDLPIMLLRQMEADPQNRVAFEYLMADLMLTGRLGLLAQEMRCLPELGYSHIPRHWEEALLVFEAATGRRVDLGDYVIRPETRGRFEVFSRARAAYGRDRVAAAKALAPAFGDTYFFYNAFLMGGDVASTDVPGGDGGK